jgi:hypothetical protein
MIRRDLWISIEKTFSDSKYIEAGKQDNDKADAEDDPQWQH